MPAPALLIQVLKSNEVGKHDNDRRGVALHHAKACEYLAGWATASMKKHAVSSPESVPLLKGIGNAAAV